MEFVSKPALREIVAVKQLEFASEILTTTGETLWIEERAHQYLARRLTGPKLWQRQLKAIEQVVREQVPRRNLAFGFVGQQVHFVPAAGLTSPTVVYYANHYLKQVHPDRRGTRLEMVDGLPDLIVNEPVSKVQRYQVANDQVKLMLDAVSQQYQLAGGGKIADDDQINYRERQRICDQVDQMIILQLANEVHELLYDEPLAPDQVELVKRKYGGYVKG